MRAVSASRSILVVLIASVMMGAPLLAAQTMPPAEGITVVGNGRASAPADSSILQITLSSAMFGQPMPAQPGATPGAEEMEAAQPVVDNLVAAGVAEDDITVIAPPFLGNAFSGPYGPASALITITVNDPSADVMVELINAATLGAADSGMMVGSISAMHTVADCAALKTEARQSAFANAQDQAAAQADILGVTLGGVVGSRDYPYSLGVAVDPTVENVGDGSCTSSGMSDVYGPYGPTPYDLAMAPEVVVYVDMDVTFAIEGGPTATPAS